MDERCLSSIRLLKCGICGWWYLPKAHNNHCEMCGSGRIMFRGKPIYINWQTLRTTVRHGGTFPNVLKRLLASAALAKD